MVSTSIAAVKGKLVDGLAYLCPCLNQHSSKVRISEIVRQRSTSGYAMKTTNRTRVSLIIFAEEM